MLPGCHWPPVGSEVAPHTWLSLPTGGTGTRQNPLLSAFHAASAEIGEAWCLIDTEEKCEGGRGGGAKTPDRSGRETHSQAEATPLPAYKHRLRADWPGTAGALSLGLIAPFSVFLARILEGRVRIPSGWLFSVSGIGAHNESHPLPSLPPQNKKLRRLSPGRGLHAAGCPSALSS